MDTKESIAARMPKRPGNFGGETFREWCGLSKRRNRNPKAGPVDGPITAQDVYRVCRRRGV
jgi:hypothetical protein